MDVAPGDRVGGGFGRAGLTVGPGDPKGLCQPKQFHHSTFGFHQHCSRSCLVVTHMAAVLKQLSLSFSSQKEINSDNFFFFNIYPSFLLHLPRNIKQSYSVKPDTQICYKGFTELYFGLRS